MGRTIFFRLKKSYLHEISPKEWRGAIVSVNEACISLGFVISYLTGYLISVAVPNDGWRYMFGLGVIIAVIQFCGMLYMPESPVWLKTQERHQEAAIVIMRINELEHGILNQESDSVRNNYISEKDSPFNSKRYSSVNVSRPESIDSSFSTTSHGETNSEQNSAFVKTYYRQMVIAIFMAVMQQFCGNPTVLNFAPEIFAQLGLESRAETLMATVLLGAMKCLITCSVIWKIEHFGRRNLLLLGLCIMAISLFLLTIAYTSIDEYYGMTTMSKWIATIGVFGVAAGFSFSFGPLTWLLVSELFPATIRGRALGASTIITYMAGSLVSYTFLTFQRYFSAATPFGIYCVLTSLSIAFSCLAIPDTGSKDPVVIAKEIENMAFWRRRNGNTASLTGFREDIEIV